MRLSVWSLRDIEIGLLDESLYLFLSDVDECNDGGHECHSNAECINTAGYFECRCKEGYIGNGSNCEGAVNLKQEIIMISKLLNLFAAFRLVSLWYWNWALRWKPLPFSFRCWWVQWWWPWMSLECRVYKHRWLLWMPLQGGIHREWTRLWR